MTHFDKLDAQLSDAMREMSDYLDLSPELQGESPRLEAIRKELIYLMEDVGYTLRVK